MTPSPKEKAKARKTTNPLCDNRRKGTEREYFRYCTRSHGIPSQICVFHLRQLPCLNSSVLPGHGDHPVSHPDKATEKSDIDLLVSNELKGYKTVYIKL